MDRPARGGTAPSGGGKMFPQQVGPRSRAGTAVQEALGGNLQVCTLVTHQEAVESRPAGGGRKSRAGAQAGV